MYGVKKGAKRCVRLVQSARRQASGGAVEPCAVRANASVARPPRVYKTRAGTLLFHRHHGIAHTAYAQYTTVKSSAAITVRIAATRMYN